MTNKQHPALEQAPKNLREALERIRDYAKENPVLPACMYQGRSGLRRIIGQFFTQAQLDYIKAHKDKDGISLNHTTVRGMAVAIGKENIEAMTGMTVEQAHALQYQFDNFPRLEFLKRLDAVLRGEKAAFDFYIFDVK